jgi:hypothetical protein
MTSLPHACARFPSSFGQPPTSKWILHTRERDADPRSKRGGSIADRSVASASAISTKGAPQTCRSTRDPAPPISVEPPPRTPRSPPSRAGHVFSRSASQPSVSAQRHKISPQATPRFLRATAPHPSLPCARASLSTRLRLSAERGSTIRPSPSPVRASQVLPFQPPPGREERPQNRKKANVRPKHHRRHRTSASAGEAGHGRPGGAGRQSERRGPASWMCSSVLERYTTGGLNRERERL